MSQVQSSDPDEFDKYDIAILNAVATNPLIHSNGLRKKLVDEQHLMSARTLDIHKIRLLRSNHLAEKPEGGKKRLYRISPRLDSEKIRQLARDETDLKKIDIEFLERIYPKLPQQEKIMMALYHLSNLRDNMGRLALHPCFTAEQLDFQLVQELMPRYQALVMKTLKIIADDPEGESIATIIMNKLADFHANKDPYFKQLAKEQLGY